MIARILLLSASLLAVSATSVLSHHSFAMFDGQKEMTIEGTVLDYAWNNPHVWIDITVTDAQGRTVKWGLESRSLGILSRLGWKHDSLKAGDRVKAKIHPMKDGSPGGQVMTISFPDGRELVTQGAGVGAG